MTGYTFLAKPNLPDKKVIHAVVSPQYPHLLSALKQSGVIPLTVTSCDNVLFPLRNHTDMLFSYLGNGKFAAEQSQNYLTEELGKLGMNCVCNNVRLKPDYPLDIPLNCCIIGENIICKSENTADFLKSGKTIINVKQGYAKCSSVPVDENSLITDDLTVFKAAYDYGIDVLLVKKGCVKLDGFDTGFIGGCCGKLSKDILAFCGDITTHSDYRQINSFLRERNVYPYQLFSGELIDIGSIIPITQYL